MRIKVVRRPNDSCIDGVRLHLFVPGHQYDVGTTLGMLFLAEGWGEPAEGNGPAMVIPIDEFCADQPRRGPRNLIREIYPPYVDELPSMAADRRRRPRG